jgi:hypothetical protein
MCGLSSHRLMRGDESIEFHVTAAAGLKDGSSTPKCFSRTCTMTSSFLSASPRSLASWMETQRLWRGGDGCGVSIPTRKAHGRKCLPCPPFCHPHVWVAFESASETRPFGGLWIADFVTANRLARFPYREESLWASHGELSRPQEERDSARKETTTAPKQPNSPA